MKLWLRLLLQYGVPVLAEALLALIRGLEDDGADPDAALSFAIDVVAGLEDSLVPPADRRERAADALILHLTRKTGRTPSRARCNALVEIALQRVRNAPA